MSITASDFDANHHIQITCYLVDGPNDWTRPEDPPGARQIAGIKISSAEMMIYPEIVANYFDLARERTLKSLEDLGVLRDE